MSSWVHMDMLSDTSNIILQEPKYFYIQAQRLCSF